MTKINERILTHSERMPIYWKPEGDYEGRLLITQDAKSVAARDKWWIENLNGIIHLSVKSADQRECVYCKLIEREWNLLKREVGQ